MIVVADTGPIRYLILIEEISVLVSLFGSVVVPPAVADELRHLNAPASVRAWMDQPPAWFAVAQTQAEPVAALQQLDRGEQEAIQLALERIESADEFVLLLIDERLGRAAAKSLNVPSVGTLGILEQGSKAGLLDLRRSLENLLNTNFRISQDAVDDLLRKYPERE